MTKTVDDLWINGPDDLAQTPRTGKHVSRRPNFIGCPLPWLKRVLPAVQSAGQLAVALYVYRRTKICGSKTVILSNAELELKLGVSRFTKYRALSNLEGAGIAKLGDRTGSAVKITLLK
jgi:hypothetical protein